MGRKQEWDEGETLGSAFRLFRQRGYHTVTMRDLEAATGLNPGSLYHRYRSKDGVFAAALDAYIDEVVETRVRIHLTEADDPVEGIHALFASTLPPPGSTDPGCLLTNTAIESYAFDPPAEGSPEVALGVRRGLDVIERGLTAAVERAQGRGQLPRGASAADVAAQLLVLYQGVLVMVRLGSPTETVRATARAAVDALLNADPTPDPTLVPTKGRTR